MSQRSQNIGRYIARGFAVAMLAGGIALLASAAHTAPTEPHHGSPVDGLDAFATLAALVEAGFALVLLVSGALILRSTLGRAPSTPPRPPPPVSLPRAQVRNAPPR